MMEILKECWPYLAGAVIAVPAFLFLAAVISWRLKWAVFIDDKHLPDKVLKGKHDDWWWIFKKIPRRINAFACLKKNKKPIQLLGSNPKSHKQDVPLSGTWCISWPPHFAFNTKKGLDGGVGIRYDYKGYYTLRLTIKRFKEIDSQ